MKRVKCPRCDNFITFDERQYTDGQQLVFQCPQCKKQFSIRIGVSKLRATHKEEPFEEEEREAECGSLVVIENVFHYKQVLPLRLGDNVVGRYIQGTTVNTPIETADPSVDTRHCVITVSRTPKGLSYALRDAPSLTGTYLGSELLRASDRITIEDGSIITIGATSMILHTPQGKAD
ncbi:MAG: FHA domain-containing protein [Prevotellaceae bacterium]|nr:FHA domain-containing protein [Prevotellaceae bacterium]